MAKTAGNGFGFAKVGKVVETPTKKASKNPILEMKGVEAVASLDWAETAISTVKGLYMAELKDAMVEHFIEVGVARKAKPENFTGTEGTATASCQLRKRSSRSVLTDEEVVLCEEHNIPIGTETLVEDTFVFDMALLEKWGAQIEVALSQIPGLPVKDIIKHQEGRTVRIVTDESVDAAFKLSPENCAIVLPVLTTPSVSPKIEGDAATIMKKVADIMSMPVLAEVIAGAKKKKSSSKSEE